MFGRDGTEASIVVEAAVLVIMHPLYIPCSARERVCCAWAAACHRELGKEADTNDFNTFFLIWCVWLVSTKIFFVDYYKHTQIHSRLAMVMINSVGKLEPKYYWVTKS